MSGCSAVKVGYVTLGDIDSTAYLDESSDTGLGIFEGADKYTDAPVAVRWNDGLQRWEEIRMVTVGRARSDASS
jgi:hypothetical protein